MAKIKVKQVRSCIGKPKRQGEIIKGLGLRRLNHVVEIEDTRENKASIFKVQHLVKIVD